MLKTIEARMTRTAEVEGFGEKYWWSITRADTGEELHVPIRHADPLADHGGSMTVDEMRGLFEKHSEEYIKFERVENARSRRADLHAFLLLDELVPGGVDMVCAAEHDEIFLDVEPEELAAAATEAQIIELIRCGVMLNDEVDSLSMFV